MEGMVSIQRTGITPSANKQRINTPSSSSGQIENGTVTMKGFLHSYDYEERSVTRSEVFSITPHYTLDTRFDEIRPNIKPKYVLSVNQALAPLESLGNAGLWGCTLHHCRHVLSTRPIVTEHLPCRGLIHVKFVKAQGPHVSGERVFWDLWC
ncbi:hypothetical protein TNCV_1544591 [Trichonephila clavipes]|nr:hypothetical protein TNCV_1544591 [Trichonephila clavipes]